MNFSVFALWVIGTSLILAWVYGSSTQSVLLCIMYHASSNAVVALGVTVPHDRVWLGLIGASLNLIADVLLVRRPTSEAPPLTGVDTL